MAKSLSTIRSEMCESGIGRMTSPVSLLQAIGQLYDDAAISPPTPPPSHTPEVIDWMARIAAAGGAAPSEDTANALDALIYDLEAANIKSAIINLNPFVPDNETAARTPLIKAYGSDIYAISGSLTLSINGIQGIGGYLNTGVIPSTAFANNTSFGVSVYMYQSVAEARIDFGAQTILSGSQAVTLYSLYSDNNLYFDCWGPTGDRVSAANGGFNGFLCAQRTATNLTVYKASSTVPFGELANMVDAVTGSRPDREIYVFATNQNGTPSAPSSSKTFSSVVIHAALTPAQAEDLYDALQSMRTWLGGGFR